MRVFITGGAGYIGTSLIPLLLGRGYTVTVYDVLLFGAEPLLPFFRNKNFIFIKGDVRDKASLQKAMRGQEVVIHLAAIVGAPACERDPLLARTTNVDGTRNLAELVTSEQCVLYGSTGSNYGAIVDGVCTEDLPLNPLSVYGKTKTEAEGILMRETPATAYRFATSFGLSPRLRLDLLVNDLTYQAVTQRYLVVFEADFMRSFIHVHDIARSFLFAIDNRQRMLGEVYNIGNETMNFSKRALSGMIAKKTGAYVHYADIREDEDKRNYSVSYKKVRELRFETTVGLDEGIDELVEAFKAFRVRNPYANA